MTIEREVYDDLVTVAEAGMASPATLKLLEECRARHPEWAAARLLPEELPRAEIPGNLEREALKRTQRLLSRRSWFMFFGIGLCAAPMTIVWTDRIEFLLYRDQPLLAGLMYALGLVSWVGFVWTNRRLTMAGLAQPPRQKRARWAWALGAMGVLAPAMMMLSHWTGHREPLIVLAAIVFVSLAAATWAARIMSGRTHPGL
jgi:hypothetical protein